MIRSSFSLGVAALAACVSLSGPAAARSTFQQSCGNIRIHGAVLTADCQRRNGSWRTSSIEIPGIENDDGHLVFTGIGGASSFQLSCSRLKVDGDVLRAQCRTRNGDYRNSAIRIEGIDNIDGDLRYQ